MTLDADLARRLAADFVWGVATSAFQIEGAAREDGKGESIWGRFCRVPGAIADASTGDAACDHCHRLDGDLDLIADPGVDAHRFSVSWPRVLPDGAGAWNARGLDFYDRLAAITTHNEPWVIAMLGHESGVFAPGLKRRRTAWQASRHRLLSHGLALQALRAGGRLRQALRHRARGPCATAAHAEGQRALAPGTADPAQGGAGRRRRVRWDR